MNIVKTLLDSAALQPDQTAVYYGKEAYLSWRGLAERVEKLAAALQALGLKAGDRVGIAMKNSPSYIEILYACWRLGLVAVPMNAKGHPSDFQYMIEHSGAKVCFVSADLVAAVSQAVQASDHGVAVWVAESRELNTIVAAADTSGLSSMPESSALPAWLFYTSGTTGRPKGATLTHGNLLAMADAFFIGINPVEAGDHLVHAAPMSHGSGLYIIPHLMKGASQVIPKSGKFQAEELVDLINYFTRCTVFAAPTMLQRLLDDPATDSLPGLKTMVLGGGPLYVHDCMAALEKFGPKLAQIYGQGETPMTITGMSTQEMYSAYQDQDMAYLGSVGKPFAAVEVAVVDGHDQPLAPGESGEIVVRGATVMQGYWNNAAATAETVRDGWLHTGDIGAFDERGVLTLKDRSKDLIISGGTNIYPREVEEVLIAHPGVAEACVVGIPDDEWGESVAAVLVSEANSKIDIADIDRFCIEHLARFKRPKRYLVTGELPKNATGKVLKAEVKNLLG